MTELSELGDGGPGSLGETVPRRSFVRWTGIFGVAALAPSVVDRWTLGSASSTPVEFPRNDLSLVNGVVGASHGNLDRVRDLVLEQPGAPAVVLRFDVVDGRARALTVEDGAIRMTGRRV
jgi:hypothetical protein